MNRTQYVDQIINGEIERKNISGANVCIAKEHEILYQKSYGYADIENGREMEKNTIFRMFSMTKPVTAAAAMILFERGMIDLYDPVSKYLDGFQNQYVAENGVLTKVNCEMTLQHLLSMTSGLSYPDENTMVGRLTDQEFKAVSKAQDEGKPISTVDFCNRMGRLPLMFQPGGRWMYGTSADVMGAVIEVASGKRFGEFLKDEIFKPLGMDDTGFYVPREKQKRFAQIYRHMYETKELVPHTLRDLGMEGYLEPPAFESGGAGLVSTIGDYLKFAKMLLNEGTYNGSSVLSRKTVDFMRKNQLTSEQARTYNWDSAMGYGYGNFMRILMDKGISGTNGSNGEFGWDGWTGNYVTIDPSEQFIILYFIQRCDTGFYEATRKLRSVAYSMI